MSKTKRTLRPRHYLVALREITVTSFRAAPVAVGMKVFGAVLNAVLPIVTIYFAAATTTALAQAYLDNGESLDRVILYVAITVALGLTQTVWGAFAQYVNELARYKIESAISDQMYAKFMALDYAQYDDKATADTFDRAKQFANYFGYGFDRLTNLLTQAITMIAGLVAMFLVSWWLGLILLVAIVPSLLVQLKLSRMQAAHWNAHVETRRTRSMIEWNMFEPRHIAELRLYGMARYLLDLRKRLRSKDERERILFEKRFIPRRLFADTIEAGAEITALVYTVVRIVEHHAPIGDFIFVQQVVSRALSGARGFIEQLGNIDQEIANLFDYQEFMKMAAATRTGKRRVGDFSEVSFDHVSFTYPFASQPALHDVSLTVKAGQHIAVVGENGAGKSTFIKLLVGLYAPNTGEIHVNGDDLETYDMASWHKQLAVLQQEYLAFGFANAKDNVYYGDVSQPFDQERFDRAISKAEARSFLEKLPKGVDNYVINWMEHEDGTKGVNLSGGQWQRLALARNFYRDSPIIILDEPTSAIDSLAESRIFRHLFADKKRTVITVSHRLSTVEKADVIYMLEGGRIVESGAHAELVAKQGAYYKLFESQL